MRRCIWSGSNDGVVDHVVVRRRDGALADRLRNQEEVVPIRGYIFTYMYR